MNNSIYTTLISLLIAITLHAEELPLSQSNTEDCECTSENSSHEALYFSRKKERANERLQALTQRDQLKKAHRLRAGGIVTIVLGTSGVLLGTPLIGYGIATLHSDEPADHSGAFMPIMLGSVPTGLGIVSITAGCLLYARGKHIRNEFEPQVSLIPLLNPIENQYGALVSFSF